MATATEPRTTGRRDDVHVAPEKLHEPGVEKAVFEQTVQYEDVAERHFAAQQIGSGAERFAAVKKVDPLRQRRGRGVADAEEQKRQDGEGDEVADVTAVDRVALQKHQRKRDQHHHAGDGDGRTSGNEEDGQRRQDDQRQRGDGDPLQCCFGGQIGRECGDARHEQKGQPEERDEEGDEGDFEEQRRDMRDPFADGDVAEEDPRQRFDGDECVERLHFRDEQSPHPHPPLPRDDGARQELRDGHRDQHRPGRLERGEVEKGREKKRCNEKERDEVADAVAIHRCAQPFIFTCAEAEQRDRRGGRDEKEKQHGEVVAQLRRVLDGDASNRDMRRRRNAAQQQGGREKESRREAERRQPKERADDARREVASLLLDHAREYTSVVRASSPASGAASRPTGVSAHARISVPPGETPDGCRRDACSTPPRHAS